RDSSVTGVQTCALPILTINYLYDLPFGKGQALLSQSGVVEWIVGGWQVGGITTVGTGTPFSPAFTSTIQGSPSGRPNVVGDWHEIGRASGREGGEVRAG